MARVSKMRLAGSASAELTQLRGSGMRHLNLEDGRRRRKRLLWCWIAAVVVVSIMWLRYGSDLPGRLGLLLVMLVAAASALPSLAVRQRNDEVARWYLSGQCRTCGHVLRA